MIRAVIYDMDGLLLDSEPLWQEAEIRVFGGVGISLTREQCMEFMGVPVGEVVARRFREKPWSGRTREQVKDEIIAAVEALVLERGRPLPGVRESLAYMRRKELACALASSSAMRLIETVLQKFGLNDSFSVVHSAEQEEHGKPHPAVFLTTARKLGIDARECLVLEDSVNGVIAGKAAGMQVIAIPAAHHRNDPRFAIADLRLRSLEELGDEVLERLGRSTP